MDRRKKTTGQSRGHLAHCEDLNAVCAGAGGVDPGHMSGESRMHHDRTPHVLPLNERQLAFAASTAAVGRLERDSSMARSPVSLSLAARTAPISFVRSCESRSIFLGSLVVHDQEGESMRYNRGVKFGY
jgi:hypothetical protein